MPEVADGGAQGVTTPLRKCNEAAKKPFPNAADPNRFQNRTDPRHLNGLRSEEQLANRIHNNLPDEQVVLWGKGIGTHGADVVSVNTKTGEVTLWDSKWRTNPTKIKESRTFSNGGTRQSAIDEALDSILNDSSLSPNTQQQAVGNLNNGKVRVITSGEGPGALNSDGWRY